MSPRTGRPTKEPGKPLSNDIKVRIDDELNARLLAYCEKNDISKADAIRKAIYLLLSKEN